MNAEQIKMTIKAAIQANRPVYVSGPPGVGKSQIVRQVAEQTERKLFDIRAALRQPVDFLGLPDFEERNGERVTVFRPPGELPRAEDGPSLLFLDELPNAPLLTQSALLELSLDRRCGTYTLPDDCGIVAAGNRATDRAGAGRLIASLADRFIQIAFDVDAAVWTRWALNAGIQTEIIAFLRFRPELVADIDSSRAVNASPRSWEMLSDIMPFTSPELLHETAAGIVGPGPAAEFSAFLAVFKTLPDPLAVLLNPAAAEVPTDPSTLYALCGALAAIATDLNGPQVIAYANRLKEEGAAEFGILLMRDAVVKCPGVTESRDFQQWAIDNHETYAAA